jgi:hypothetical protein
MFLQPYAIFSGVLFFDSDLTGLVLTGLLVVQLLVAFFSLSQEVSKLSSKLVRLR